jgi:hypothetical protein
LRSAAGGRNEETNSKYAEGIRVRQYPSRRQHKQVSRSDLQSIWGETYEKYTKTVRKKAGNYRNKSKNGKRRFETFENLMKMSEKRRSFECARHQRWRGREGNAVKICKRIYEMFAFSDNFLSL